MKRKIIGIFVVTLLIAATVLPVAGTMNDKEITASTRMVDNNVNHPNIQRTSIESSRSGLFTQLPALPGDPMPYGWTSASPFAWKCYEDFWEVTSPICNIHWWGQPFFVDDDTVYPGDPEGMTFNIVFWEDDNGEPGAMICSYVDVIPSFTSTGIMYDYPEFPEGPLELYYFETQLDPCCELSDGWISIQSTYSPSDCGFAWQNSSDGNDIALQYGWGYWYNRSGFAFMLTDGGEEPVPDLDCDGSLSWTNVNPGDTVIGNFSIRNNGEADSILHWKIESYPSWGG